MPSKTQMPETPLSFGRATAIGAGPRERALAQQREQRAKHPFVSYLMDLLSGGATDPDFEPGPADLAMAALPLVSKPLSAAEQALARELEPALAKMFGARGPEDLMAAAARTGANRQARALKEQAARDVIQQGELTRTVQSSSREGMPAAERAYQPLHWEAAESPMERARRVIERVTGRSLGGGTVPELGEPVLSAAERDLGLVRTELGRKQLPGTVRIPSKAELAEIRKIAAQDPKIRVAKPSTPLPRPTPLPTAEPSPTVIAVLGGRNIPPDIQQIIEPTLAKAAAAQPLQIRVGTGPGLEQSARQAIPPAQQAVYSTGRVTRLPRAGTEGLRRTWDVTPIRRQGVQDFLITPQELPASAMRPFKIPGHDIQKQPGFSQALALAEQYGPTGSPAEKIEQAGQILQLFGPKLTTPARSVITFQAPPWIRSLADQAGIKVIDTAIPSELERFTAYLAKSKK